MIEFFVPGLPKTAGSKSGFYNKKLGRVMMVDACKDSKNWQADVKAFAMPHRPSELFHDCPVGLELKFLMPRPKYHFNSKGKLKVMPHNYHIKKPDLLKMTRAIEDALTGIIWQDDALICHEVLTKKYDTNSFGVWISIYKMADEEKAEFTGLPPGGENGKV